MGTATSKSSGNTSHGDEEQAGGQLYISLKMENYMLKGDLVPHVFGSAPLIGSWDSSKALPMEKESASLWELSFVVPPNHETLDFKFLLKPKDGNNPCIIEEGTNRVLCGGKLQGDSSAALFRLNSDAVLEYRIRINADRVSPFDLASSWRAYQHNIQPSAVRGIPDVSMNSGSETAIESGSSATLELDLEHYVVPSPATSGNLGLVYPANMAETPSGPTVVKDLESTMPDPDKVYTTASVVEEKPIMNASPLQKQESHKGLFVDRGVGSPKLVKSASADTVPANSKDGSENKTAMPAAAGAVAAAAVADQMLGPKEDRHLAIVLVGLPARGKTFTAAKLTRYLRWLGHDTKHFNVGKYRRLKLGTNQSADFFRGDNPEGIEARNE
ncbi:6-phosphofructo-2-kinase/fructose-2 6-bisphosphatase, partial [Bienertia sinuspersici]